MNQFHPPFSGKYENLYFYRFKISTTNCYAIQLYCLLLFLEKRKYSDYFINLIIKYTFRCIPIHSNISGNETTDEIASKSQMIHLHQSCIPKSKETF